MAEPRVTLPQHAAQLLPAALARAYRVVPWRTAGECLELLSSGSDQSQLADDLRFALNREVRLLAGDPAEIQRLIELHYGKEEQPAKAATEKSERDEFTLAGDEPTLSDLTAMADQPPIIRLVNQVLAQAIRDRASDVHFEPFDHEFKIRRRVDGVLHELASPPQAFALPVTSRIKVLANLNIAERRTPQDGRIRITLEGRAVDLRVSTLPTQFGESVVVRVLDQSAVQLDLRELGLPSAVLAGFQQALRRPNGIILVTGPTGSGKTTTLYGGLHAINTPDLKLLTIEDPVEYEIEGIMQVPINPVAGLTFATALRSFLRQDPDVIMVGEIRDQETAQIAVQASLTGHLVLSTLHTNDAPAAVTRLVDMGVEPFLLGTTLEAVLAQRLVRRICPHCRTACPPRAELLCELGCTAAHGQEQQSFHGRGCAQCGQTGYRGRLGIFEWLVMTEALRELIIQNAPVQTIREKARESGMRTLREEGLRAVGSGDTTLEEVARQT